ncbi:MAG: hemerythrin domain-containing protein [Syntrophales bacterium]|jgi:hemerythrin-like domain-containing protein|nr:hemerythrin domain-containing protein [Syntrophales bacterium]
METKASLELREEHEGIRVMLRIMEAIRRQAQDRGDLNEAHFAAILEFLDVFVDRCHHAKEEELLFPALEKKGVSKDGGPMSVILHEHVLGRRLVEAMGASFGAYSRGNRSALKEISASIQEYISLLSEHIEKESGILFDMADYVLSETEQEALHEGFDRIETERIGAGKHEEFHALLHTLSGIYLKKA